MDLGPHAQKKEEINNIRMIKTDFISIKFHVAQNTDLDGFEIENCIAHFILTCKLICFMVNFII